MSLSLGGCASEEAYQSPWTTPHYDPYTYNPAQAEQNSNFPVFNKQPHEYSPIPAQVPTQVEEQSLPDPRVAGAPNPYYSMDNQGKITSQYPEQYENTGVINESAPVKVGILLPLSGQSADVGKALLNAMQLALFDIADNKVAMIVKDTKGTPEGAKLAANAVLRDGAQIILGPLFSAEVKEVAPIASEQGINVITFSTDWSTAGNNVFVMGFLPFTQVSRVVDYAIAQGHKNFAAFSPKTGYGAAVVNTLQQVLKDSGLREAKVERFAPDENLTPLIRNFTNYDSRSENLTRRKGQLYSVTSQGAQAELATLENKRTYGPIGFDAVLLPVSGDMERKIASAFQYFEVDTNQVKLIGTGLWDDDEMMREPTLQGAWFAAPDPSARQGFERNYIATYSNRPPRIATLGYDSMALVAVLSYKGIRAQGTPYFDKNSITNPNGFAGIDGVFRFRPDGLVERGLAVLEIRQTGAVVIDPAPRSFVR